MLLLLNYLVLDITIVIYLIWFRLWRKLLAIHEVLFVWAIIYPLSFNLAG